MTTLTITRGLPGTGKTTWSRKQTALERANGRTTVRISRDDMRDFFFGTRTGLTRNDEEFITQIEHTTAGAALLNNWNVIVDAMHLRPRYVRAWRTLAHKYNAEFHIKHFPTTLDEALRINTYREHPIPEDTLRTIARKFYPRNEFLPILDDPEPNPAALADTYRPDPKLAPAVIVDVDGTIALLDGRDPYDFTRVSEDRPNTPVIKVVQLLAAEGNTIVFVSGRDDSCSADTEDWIDHHVNLASPWELHMRATGDHRRDAVIKREIFDAHIRDRYNVGLVIDDRNSVVAMWRDLGLTCLQPQDGDF